MKCFLLLWLLSISAPAQTKTAVGRVTSADDGSALPGVYVVEKATDNGTVTNSEGRFSLPVAPDATLVVSYIGFQTREVRVENTAEMEISLKLDIINDWPVVNVGYGWQTIDRTVGATSGLTDDDFNQGNVYDPAQLWQGKVAGLSIYNRGGNPNSEYLLRIRGLSTLDPNSAPLVVVDGVPMSTLHNVDPHDIESISVLKDGASAAIYGMRASPGVILVSTKRGLPGISVLVQSEGAASTLMRKQPVMTAEEHIAAGANDLGSSTDWQDEITRTGISGNFHVAISGANQTSSFRVATHVRSADGILLHSGFDQVNTRVNVRHRALNDRLRFDFNMAVNKRESNLSFPEAFRYANTFLPSAPAYFPNGDFYQAILFDNYNPVAMLEQNVNLARRRSTNYSGRVNFDIVENLTLAVNAGQQFENNLNGAYYSRESFYMGLQRNGLAQRYTDDSNFTFAESYLTWLLDKDKVKWNFVGGFSYQEDEFESFGAELGDFPSDLLGYNAIGYSADILKGQPNLIDIFSTTSPRGTIRAAFLRANAAVGEFLTFNASIRQEKSNRLGVNQQSGVFPAIGAGLDLLKFLPMENLSMLKLHAGYGVTGSIPRQSDLAEDQYEYSLNTGTLHKVRDANQELRWEKKNETNIGIDFSAGFISGAINFYHRNVTDIIQPRYVSSDVGVRYENVAGLKVNGLELTLDCFVGNWGSLTWQPSVVMGINRMTLDSYPIEAETRGFVDAAGFGGTQMVKVAVDGVVGNIWGPLFSHVGVTGYPSFVDTNGDGVENASPGTALASNTDYVSLGSGTPPVELGWSNILAYRRWDMNAFFRGAFGHSLVNLLRMSFEPLDAGSINSYNRVQTDKAIEGLATGAYSSLYVEKAGFLKLDNVTLGYSFPGQGTSWLRSLRIYATVQNAFVITGYTGVDPEPSLVDRFPTSPTIPPDPLVSGIDRNGNYSPALTFLLGVTVKL